MAAVSYTHLDPDRQVKFSTYAVPMIIGEIRRYLRDNSSLRVSRSLRDIAYKVIYTREGYIRKNMKEPSIQEIAEEIAVSYTHLFYLVIPFCMLWLKNRKQCMLQILKGMGLLYLFGMFLGGTLMMFRPYLHYISLFYGIAVLSSQGILMTWKFLKVLKIEQERCCEVILFTEADSYKVHALRDTGNCLTDPLSGEGVHVLDCNFYHQVMKEAMEFRYIPYRSVHGSGIMKIFQMCIRDRYTVKCILRI